MNDTAEQNQELVGGEVKDIAPARAGNPLDIPTEAFSQALERRGTNRKALIQWVRDSLVDGVDFGKIKIKNTWSKPSLWKPGAEKICGMLGVTPVYPRMKDYEEAALNGVAIQSIVIRCHLIDGNGNTVADGIGARNIKQDNGDLNKALKMACKSAHIDATLRMAGLSEVFTQDIEDQISTQQAEQEVTSTEPVTEEQVQEIEDRIDALLDSGKMSDSKPFFDWLKREFDVTNLDDLKQNGYQAVCDMLARKEKGQASKKKAASKKKTSAKEES